MEYRIHPKNGALFYQLQTQEAAAYRIDNRESWYILYGYHKRVVNVIVLSVRGYAGITAHIPFHAPSR